MATAMQVKIGPEFFKKELMDYSNWRWAYVREALQNCFDAPGCDRVDISLKQEGVSLRVTFENNGAPMDEDTLVNKLFALGASGKNFAGTVGGFGKAKVLLYMSQSNYKIRSGELEVVGCGGDYELSTGRPFFHGTRSEVVIPSGVDTLDRFTREFERFLAMAQWSGVVSLNGREWSPSLRKGSPRRELDFGVVYSNKTFENRLIVRMNGIPMFHTWIEFKKCVILELNGTSGDILTSNRDGLQHPHSNELTNLIEELAINKRSGLRSRQSKITHYEGEKLVARPSFLREIDEEDAIISEQSVLGGEELGDAVLASRSEDEEEAGVQASGVVLGSAPSVGSGVTVERLEVRRTVRLESEFWVKNDSEMEVPSYYYPENFGEYPRKLVSYWAKCLMELHKVFNHEATFAVGFIFDETSEAQYSEDNGAVYYLNPAEIVRQMRSKSRSMKKRFKLSQRDRIIMIALHEFVHALGYSYHDEDFANILTDKAAVVMANRKRFNRCFR